MSAESLKYLMIGLITLGFLFDKFTSWLNVRQKVPQVPATLQNFLDQEKLQEAKSYQKTNYYFGLISGSFSLVITLGMLIWGGFGLLDQWVSQW
ncbi:hypothetical protein [Echinicola jeungdonensis]